MASLSGISSGFQTTSLYAKPRTAAAGAGASAAGAAAGGTELTQDQQAQVRELQKTDAQVKAHEQAHKAAGGPYAGGIQYEYTTGPDGRRYATAGEVPIDTAAVRGNPDATIAKMEVVKRAALSPQDPSPQDRAVAAKADAVKAQAQNERNQGAGASAEAASDSETGSGLLQQQEAANAEQTQSGPADISQYRQAIKNYARAGNNVRPGLSVTA